jgi:hypothetical protein
MLLLLLLLLSCHWLVLVQTPFQSFESLQIAHIPTTRHGRSNCQFLRFHTPYFHHLVQYYIFGKFTRILSLRFEQAFQKRIVHDHIQEHFFLFALWIIVYKTDNIRSLFKRIGFR